MTPRHQRRIGRQAFLIVVCIAASSTTSYNRSIRSIRGNVRFAIEAAGREATRSGEWELTLRPASSEPIGLITAAAFCEDEVFLLDSRQSVAHRIDLLTASETGAIGASSDGPDQPRRPRAMAIDCAGHTLYLIDRTGVFVFSLTSGGVEGHFSHPANFSYTGGTALVDAPNGALYVPGLWTAAKWSDWLHRDLDRMFEGDRVGYRLSLRDGTTKPLFKPLERGCWSVSASCLQAVFDEVRTGGPERWVAAQRVSTRVGLFDAQFRLQRVLDVRSPRFRENGQRLGRHDSVTDQTRWREDNSTIERVYAFGDRIVTVHTTHATKDWMPGQPIDFDVHMNIHSLDGAPLVSDVRLPDLPVARDDRNLYVLDYGRGGRRIGTDRVTLIRYPIVAGWKLFQ